MEGTWTREPLSLQDWASGVAERMGRGGKGRAGHAAPTQLNLLRDSPRPCMRKRKRKSHRDQCRHGALSYNRTRSQNSTELRQEVGFVRFSASLRRPGGLPIQAGRGRECCLPGAKRFSARSRSTWAPRGKTFWGCSESSALSGPFRDSRGVKRWRLSASELLPFLAMEEVCGVSPAETQENGELGGGSLLHSGPDRLERASCGHLSPLCSPS